MKKLLLIFTSLIVGIIIGIFYTIYNIQVVNVISPDNGNHGLVELKCCGQNMTYYYEK